MISKHAVNEFLRRPRKDYRTWKKLTRRQLRLRKEKLPVKPPIWKKLRKHQRVCFLIGARTRRFGFFLDTGTGKTLLTIALIRYFQKLGIVRSVLVLVETKMNAYEWLDEVNKHTPKTKIEILSGSTANKWRILNETDALIYVTTYAGLSRMVCRKVEGKKGRDKLQPRRPWVQKLAKRFSGLVMDESTAVGNHRTLPYRICRQLSQTTSILFALTGTPFGRDPQPLWSQLYLIDHGETLGPTLGLFRQVFYNESQNFWGGYERTFRKSKKRLLHRFLAHRTIRYKARQSDLPKVVSIPKCISLGKDADALYQEARKNLIAARGNFEEQKNAFVRMRQISSGFVGYYDDEQGVRAQYEIKPNLKLEVCVDLIHKIGSDNKIVVFHDFIFSGSIIERELKRLGIGFARAYGKTKDPQAEKRRFLDDPQCNVFILNSSVGAKGLNLQAAQYLIYYESPVGVIPRYQSQRRVERQDSKHDKVFIYDLICRGTVDQQILDFHREGRDLFRAIVEGHVVPR